MSKIDKVTNKVSEWIKVVDEMIEDRDLKLQLIEEDKDFSQQEKLKLLMLEYDLFHTDVFAEYENTIGKIDKGDN